MEVEETNEDSQSALLSEIVISSKSFEFTFRKLYIVHKTTPEEESILKTLEEYKDSTILPREVTNKLVEDLSQF
ncbi:11213_t:CDS:1, partial [Scutellospora calospora]